MSVNSLDTTCYVLQNCTHIGCVSVSGTLQKTPTMKCWLSSDNCLFFTDAPLTFHFLFDTQPHAHSLPLHTFIYFHHFYFQDLGFSTKIEDFRNYCSNRSIKSEFCPLQPAVQRSFEREEHPLCPLAVVHGGLCASVVATEWLVFSRAYWINQMSVVTS